MDVVSAAAAPVLWLLLSLLCQSTAGQDEAMCDPEVLVRRNTVLRTAPMKPLTLNCTIRWQNCDTEPTVTWCKLTDINCVQLDSTQKHHMSIYQERTPGGENELISRLKFHHVTKHDNGLYRCKISQSVISHAINISVSETPHTTTGSPPIRTDPDWLIYVCVCTACAVAILIIIIICFCTLRGGHHFTGHCLCTELLRSQSGQVI
ncbi:uncharacterized protein LOC121700215 [Alosa sapidissima]|uniref:uncharacterized protein LOC121700215 n=1 Tax=Alosa sapidissima TaxID=34773 RepID=UPI001C091790|nr:uncharacterized protein LOC121700215 [Alosa sapidissima]XP_041938974.1 uncharacterized protein LOC121700215 [Alosa sapidissima]